MNKFLKTKDNRIYIFKIRERYSLHSSKMVDRYQELGANRVCAYGHNLLKIENISKESNNIEELCDVYVVEKFKHIFTIDEFSKELVRCCKESDVYGAIWTKSGLRYICKLSNDGIFVPFTK